MCLPVLSAGNQFVAIRSIGGHVGPPLQMDEATSLQAPH